MNEHQEYEKDWWGDCANTYGEEEKQLTYAKYMGLTMFHNGKSPYNIDIQDKTIVDIGGGPSSLLLKCVNFKYSEVIDPCPYPQWIIDRYTQHGVNFINEPAEHWTKTADFVDEVWCYNVLQHTEYPELILSDMWFYGKVIRLFEWIETRITLGHPHSFTKEYFDKRLHGEGKVVQLNTPTLKGKAYYGIFKGLTYANK